MMPPDQDEFNSPGHQSLLQNGSASSEVIISIAGFQLNAALFFDRSSTTPAGR